MEFQDYATQETSALIAQLLASRSAVSTQQLQTMREALDAVARALEARPQLDPDIHELVGRLTHAADEAVRRAQDAARTALDASGIELETQRTENQGLVASLAHTEAMAAALRMELQTERDRADAADRDLSVTVEAHTEVEGAYRQVEAAFKHEAQARAAVEEDLGESRGLLDLALAETAQIQRQLDDQTAQNLTVTEDLAAAREQFDAACQAAEAGSTHDAHARLAVEEALQEARGLLDMALAETSQIRGDLDARMAAHAALTEETAQLRSELGERTSAHGALNAELAGVHEQHHGLTAQLEASEARVDVLESRQVDHEEHIRQLEGRLDDAVTAEANLREQIAGGEQQHTDVRAEVEALRGEVDRMASLLDAAVHATDDLAGAATFAELLGTLVTRLSIQFSRVALFRVKGSRLDGEQQIGFDPSIDITTVVIPLDVDSLVTRVVTSGAVECLAGSELAGRGGTPLGGTPAAAIALPIVLQGETLAVVYAEQAEASASARGPIAEEPSVGFAKLLVAQAVVLIMRHTQELKTLAELREYAAMLLQEAEHMYWADAEGGKNPGELRKRLTDNLDCASQLYAHRAAMEGRAAAALLDEQIEAVVEAGTPFARDLSVVVGQMSKAGAACTAETSDELVSR